MREVHQQFLHISDRRWFVFLRTVYCVAGVTRGLDNRSPSRDRVRILTMYRPRKSLYGCTTMPGVRTDRWDQSKLGGFGFKRHLLSWLIVVSWLVGCRLETHVFLQPGLKRHGTPWSAILGKEETRADCPPVTECWKLKSCMLRTGISNPMNVVEYSVCSECSLILYPRSHILLE